MSGLELGGVPIEHIMTTGGAERNAAIALRELDATVHTVVCAIDTSVPAANTLTRTAFRPRPP